jgi:hypothetical protein
MLGHPQVQISFKIYIVKFTNNLTMCRTWLNLKIRQKITCQLEALKPEDRQVYAET